MEGSHEGQSFGEAYARVYDRLYAEKDYEAECDLIERVARAHSERTVASVLDLGCGTGGHAIPLGRRGYDVVGVDRSAWMVAQAEQKIAGCADPLRVTIQQGDIRTVTLGREFDLGLMMFVVLGYQASDAGVLAVLGTARRHLRRGGLLLFDIWFGPAVLRQRPAMRSKVVPAPDGEIRRSSSAHLDAARHLLSVEFRLTQGSARHPAVTVEETHAVRYFFPDELKDFLQREGFDLVRIGAFPAFEREPGETTWNALVLARAI